MKILYFTATGNSLYVAKKIGGEALSIPRLQKEGRFDFKDEKIGIVFPVFNNSVPNIVEEFLDKAKLNSKYIFGIATYGLFSGASTRHLIKIGKRNGIEFSYINEIVMVDNYLPGFEMKQQMEGQGKKHIEERLGEIIKDIKTGRIYIKKHAVMAEPIRLLNLKMYDNEFDKKFTVNNSCNGCKTCERVCPVDNIKVDKRPDFNGNCQHCMACIQNCPQKAIHLKNEKSAARFVNSNVTLNEIMEAN
ncbi:MAG: EFR1 family ferrodoxin [Anaerocolumna sp.]